MENTTSRDAATDQNNARTNAGVSTGHQSSPDTGYSPMSSEQQNLMDYVTSGLSQTINVNKYAAVQGDRKRKETQNRTASSLTSETTTASTAQPTDASTAQPTDASTASTTQSTNASTTTSATKTAVVPNVAPIVASIVAQNATQNATRTTVAPADSAKPASNLDPASSCDAECFTDDLNESAYDDEDGGVGDDRFDDEDDDDYNDKNAVKSAAGDKKAVDGIASGLLTKAAQPSGSTSCTGLATTTATATTTTADPAGLGFASTSSAPKAPSATTPASIPKESGSQRSVVGAVVDIDRMFSPQAKDVFGCVVDQTNCGASQSRLSLPPPLPPPPSFPSTLQQPPSFSSTLQQPSSFSSAFQQQSTLQHPSTFSSALQQPIPPTSCQPPMFSLPLFPLQQTSTGLDSLEHRAAPSDFSFQRPATATTTATSTTDRTTEFKPVSSRPGEDAERASHTPGSKGALSTAAVISWASDSTSPFAVDRIRTTDRQPDVRIALPPVKNPLNSSFSSGTITTSPQSRAFSPRTVPRDKFDTRSPSRTQPTQLESDFRTAPDDEIVPKEFTDDDDNDDLKSPRDTDENAENADRDADRDPNRDDDDDNNDDERPKADQSSTKKSPPEDEATRREPKPPKKRSKLVTDMDDFDMYDESTMSEIQKLNVRYELTQSIRKLVQKGVELPMEMTSQTSLNMLAATYIIMTNRENVENGVSALGSMYVNALTGFSVMNDRLNLLGKVIGMPVSLRGIGEVANEAVDRYSYPLEKIYKRYFARVAGPKSHVAPLMELGSITIDIIREVAKKNMEEDARASLQRANDPAVVSQMRRTLDRRAQSAPAQEPVFDSSNAEAPVGRPPRRRPTQSETGSSRKKPIASVGRGVKRVVPRRKTTPPTTTAIKPATAHGGNDAPFYRPPNDVSEMGETMNINTGAVVDRDDDDDDDERDAIRDENAASDDRDYEDDDISDDCRKANVAGTKRSRPSNSEAVRSG